MEKTQHSTPSNHQYLDLKRIRKLNEHIQVLIKKNIFSSVTNLDAEAAEKRLSSLFENPIERQGQYVSTTKPLRITSDEASRSRFYLSVRHLNLVNVDSDRIRLLCINTAKKF